MPLRGGRIAPALSYFLPFFDAALPPPLGFLAPPLLPGPLSGIGNSFLPAIVLDVHVTDLEH
jgi:hypothetical protein